ncbi:MAG: DUF86 domain-containing protein [Chitinophagaceae bacterium]
MIEEFMSSISTYSEYVNDLKTQSAIERQLTIVGEAVNKFDSLHPIKLENSKKIAGFRNRLIQTYDAIDISIVWAIIKIHLPPLKNEVNLKLSQS